MYRHVVVIMDENLSLGRLLGPIGTRRFRRAPFLNRLTRRCALATNYHGLTHWSHRNYMAATGGRALRSGQVSDAASVFSQVSSHGLAWRAYEEGMRHRCQLVDGKVYDRGHNPATFYTRLRDQCLQDDVPLGTARSGALAEAVAENELPAFAWVTPDECHNMHWVRSCGYPSHRRILAGDRWLRLWIRRLAATRSYRRGRTLILVTWDEGGTTSSSRVGEPCLAHLRDPSCHEAAIAVSASIRPHTRDDRLYSHYSLLRTIESALGLPKLGHAADARTHSMRRGMGF